MRFTINRQVSTQVYFPPTLVLVVFFFSFFLISTSDLIGDIRKRKLGLVGFVVAVCLIWVLSV